MRYFLLAGCLVACSEDTAPAGNTDADQFEHVVSFEMLNFETPAVGVTPGPWKPVALVSTVMALGLASTLAWSQLRAGSDPVG